MYNVNEDAAWQRLKDLQREMENSRQMADGSTVVLANLKRLAQRAWWLSGLAAQRPPRRRPTLVQREDDPGSKVA